MGNSFGTSRSEQEDNLRKEGYRTMDDETLDKLKFLEKRYANGSIKPWIDDAWAREVEG